MENIENNNINETESKQINSNKKNWLTTLILCWFLGFLGVHRMYVGKITSGFYMLYGTIAAACILYVNLILGLVAFTIMGVFVANDFLIIAAKNFKDCYGNYIVHDKI